MTGFTPDKFTQLVGNSMLNVMIILPILPLKGNQDSLKHYHEKNVLPKDHDKLLFLLGYLKTFPLQKLHAASFEMTQPQANKWIHLLAGILRKTLKRIDELPERNNQKSDILLRDYEQAL